MYMQHARGSFALDVSGPWHCGPNHDTPKEFEYEVLVDWRRKKPDHRGFLTDNTTFQEYFDGIRASEKSCESLARDAAEELWKICDKRPRCVVVRIWAIKNAAMIEYRHKPLRARFSPEAIAGIGLLAEIGRYFVR